MKFITDVLQYWEYDWKNNRKLFWLEIFGVSSALIAATMLSVFSATAPMLLIFCMYTFSNILFIVSSKIRSASWMLLLNLVFFVLNIAGITNVLLY